MSVYVDDMNAPFRRMLMCHMIADTIPELLEMADRIGVQRRWFQGKGLYPHFDICVSKKKLAIENGAIAVTWRELVEKSKEIRERRKPCTH